MDPQERKTSIILRTIDGKDVEINPETVTNAVLDKNNTILQDVLDAITPIMLTREEYNAKIASGEINEEDKTYYYVPDGNMIDSMPIQDNVISNRSTFSSQKITSLLGQIMVSETLVIKIDINPEDWAEVPGPNGYYTANVYVIVPPTAKYATPVLSASLSDAEYAAQYPTFSLAEINRAVLNRVETIVPGTDYVTLYAYGEKPNISLTLDLNIQN